VEVEAVKSAYRRWAGVYDALFGPLLQPGRKAVMEALGCRPGERVLEVGVGTGLSLPMYPPGVDVTGIDVSREMLEKARARVARRGLSNVRALLEMDAEALSFPDATFEKVVAMYVVSIVDRPSRVLAELRRVCRPGGTIILINHSRSENPLLGAAEKMLGRFSNQIGWHPDFEMYKVLNGWRPERDARVSLFWRMLQLRNDHGIVLDPAPRA
jgi:phosphatidylethanolamine/phosphatidyl-N-methylethanolamine N-methyltransferase